MQLAAPLLAIILGGCLLRGPGGAEARRIGGRRALKARQHRQESSPELVPIYRAMDDFAVPTLTSTMLSSAPEEQPTAPQQQPITANVLLLEPMAAPATGGGDIGAGRTFHKFFFNGQSNGFGGGFGGGGGGGQQIPYIIINNPTNVSNINNNSLVNPPAAAAAAATGATGAAGLRVSYVRAQESQPYRLSSQPQYEPQQQTLTPVVYQRRDNNDNRIVLQALPQPPPPQAQPQAYSFAVPTIVMGSADLMGQDLGGGAMLMPLGLRNYLEAGGRRPDPNQRQGLRFRPFGGMMSNFGNGGSGVNGGGNAGNGNSNFNPFANFANNLRRIQFV